MNTSHPCKDKCPNFKDEQCSTCLIQEENLITIGEVIDELVEEGGYE